MAGTKPVETIHQIAAPERPPSAFGISSSVQSIGINFQVMVVALLHFQIELQSAGRSQSCATEVPCIVRIIDRKKVQRKKESGLDELNREVAIVACVPRNRCVLNTERSMLSLQRENCAERKDSVNQHQVIRRLVLRSQYPRFEWILGKHAVCSFGNMFEEDIHEFSDECRISFVWIYFPLSQYAGVIDEACAYRLHP